MSPSGYKINWPPKANSWLPEIPSTLLKRKKHGGLAASCHLFWLQREFGYQEVYFNSSPKILTERTPSLFLITYLIVSRGNVSFMLRPLGWQDLILVPLVARKVQFWTLSLDLHSLTYFILIIRLIKLLEEIMGEAENKSLIFTETKRRADELTRRMRRDGWVFSFFFFHCRQVSSWWFLLSDLDVQRDNGIPRYWCSWYL